MEKIKREEIHKMKTEKSLSIAKKLATIDFERQKRKENRSKPYKRSISAINIAEIKTDPKLKELKEILEAKKAARLAKTMNDRQPSKQRKEANDEEYEGSWRELEVALDFDRKRRDKINFLKA
jgi:hypothetical protein